GQRRSGLAEAHVAQPHRVQRLQPPADLGNVLEEAQRLLDGHVQHVRDVAALEADLERLAVVALSVALLARHVHIGQEVHLDLDLPIAPAYLAASALDVEAEAARLVAARARLRGLGEEVPDHIEQARVRGWVGPRRAPDRRLVDGDDLVQLVEAVDRAMRARALARSVQAVGHGLEQHVVDQRRLARPRHPGHAGQQAERYTHVDVAQVVLARTEDLDVAAGAPASSWRVDRAHPGQELPG